MFYVFFLLFLFGIMVIGAVLNSPDLFSVLLVIYYLGSIIPIVCLTIRRLHDIGKGGANILWIFLPLAGPIIHLVQMCGASEPRDNQYGPFPHAVTVTPEPSNKDRQQL